MKSSVHNSFPLIYNWLTLKLSTKTDELWNPMDFAQTIIELSRKVVFMSQTSNANI